MSVLRNISVLFLVIFTALFSVSALSQPTIGVGGEVTLHSTALGEDRVISISLPDDYASGNAKYPVLFLLDGRAHEQHANAALEFLTRYGLVPQMILVAVYNVDRTRDFSPVSDPTMPTSGGAPKFLDFVARELVPYIEDHYRSSGYKVIMGHSFGGTFITYSLVEEPDLFDAYISVSPFLQYADNYVVKLAARKLASGSEKNRYFYMSVGNEPAYFAPMTEFESLVRERLGRTVDIEYVKLAAENHSTIPYPSLFNGLRAVYLDWVLSPETMQKGLAAIDEHYLAMSAKYGLETRATENVLNWLGYTLLGSNNFDGAIEVLIENTRRFPQSANVYDSLGDAFEANDQLDLARENYAKACELANAQGHANTAIYQANLKRVSGDIDG